MSKETLIFNIGGVVFETYRSTLLRMPTTLGNNMFLEEHRRADRNDYFFDRDPDVFKVLMKYLRTGQLSVPPGTCGPDTMNELLFWGVQQSTIDRCFPDNDLEPSNVNQDRHGGHVAAEVGSSSNTHLIWNVLSKPGTSVAATVYVVVSYALICLSIFSLVAGTTSFFQHVQINEDDGVVYDAATEIRSLHRSIVIVELVCLVFFTAEYIVRVVTAPQKLHFVLSYLAIVDLLALLPDYIALFSEIVAMDIAVARLLRIFRILRVFRICRLLNNLQEMKNLHNTLKASAVGIAFLTCMLAVGVLVFATLIYFTEMNVVYTRFTSIPDALWWAIVTMTTVGYGDIFPITMMGKFVGSLCAMSGVLMLGLTVSVFVNNAILQSKHTPTITYRPQLSGSQLTNVMSDAGERQPEYAHRVPDNFSNNSARECSNKEVTS